MNKIHILPFIILFGACTSGSGPSTSEVEITPEPLKQSNSMGYDLKRSSGNLLDELYSDQLSKNADLNSLEQRLEATFSGKSDSTYQFLNYDGKNNSYYTAAMSRTESINDSLLKEKIRHLIIKSEEQYHQSIAEDKKLLGSIAANVLRMSDLHTVLKIAFTLPVIERYQRAGKPDDHAMRSFAERQASDLKKMDSMISQIRK